MADSKLSLQIALDHERFSKGLSNVQKRTARAGRLMTDVGKKMSIGLSVPLALIGRRVAETATEFEYQMARVAAISGSAADGLAALTMKAEELGSKTIFTARAVGQLQEEFAKLGFSAEEINQVTESTLSLAQVTGATLPRAAEIAGATLRTFGLEASQIEQVNDVVAVAISKSALDFESFAETMKYAGSQAAVSGISMEQLSAAMGVLANTGVKGSIAGTRLRMIFAKLAQEGGDVEKEFLKVIDGTMTMTEAIDRFGIRAATAIPVLQENREEFHKLNRQLNDSAGTLSVMQEVMDDTSFAVQKKLTSALENLSIQIGKALLPMLNVVLEILIKITNGFAKLPAFLQGVIVTIGALVAVIGPLLFVFGNLLTSMVSLQFLAPGVAAALSTYLLPAIIAITAIGGVVSFLAGLERGMLNVETAAQRMARAEEEATKNSIKQAAPARDLIYAYKNQNTTLDERREILKKLNDMHPETFGNLDAEATSVEDLELRYKDLTKQLFAVARARAYSAEATRLEQERLEAMNKQNIAQQTVDSLKEEQARVEAFNRAQRGVQGTKEGAGVGILAFGGVRELAEAEGIVRDQQGIIDDVTNQMEELERMIKAEGLDAVLKNLYGVGDGGGMGTPGPMTFIQEMERDLARLERFTFLTQGVGGQDTITFQADKLKILNKAVKEFSEIDDPTVRAKFADDIARIQEEIAALAPEVKTLKDQESAFDAYTNALLRFADGQDSIDLRKGLGLFADEGEMLAAQINNQVQLVNFLADALGRENDMYIEQAAVLQDLIDKKEKFNRTQQETAQAADVETDKLRAIADISFGIGQNLGEAADASKTFGQAAMEAFKDAAKAAARYAYMRYLAAVMEDESKPEAISKLVAASVGLGVLTGLVNSIPALAEGGITNGPMLAMIGDNRSGKEAVIPLEKLPSLMGKMGGNKEMELSTRLDGQDLVLASRRAKYNMFRTGR
tara:strand:+ start:2470 stop:5361 length:2892 start_codon:yes stop_codon:yes gene_type:complete